jgi:uncharacterized protein YhjY with autotransporter beta-barrel domain
LVNMEHLLFDRSEGVRSIHPLSVPRRRCVAHQVERSRWNAVRIAQAAMCGTVNTGYQQRAIFAAAKDAGEATVTTVRHAWELIRRVPVALLIVAAIFAAPHTAFSQTQLQPIADAGPDQTVVDSDGLPGESVVLDGSGSETFNDSPTSYVWTTTSGVQIGTGTSLTVRLPDGANQLRLRLTEFVDNGEGTDTLIATDDVTITVQPTSVPTANAGADRAVGDTDGQPGEVVTLDASASADVDGTIVSYEWFRDSSTPLGTSPAPVLPNVRLPDGANLITLIVRDNAGNTATDTFVITVGAAALAPLPQALTDLGLGPNEQQVAGALDSFCPQLADLAAAGGSLTAEQSDLLARCDGIFNSTEAEQVVALEQLGAQEINAVRTQALIFSRTQYEGVMDRLLALRSGERGVSVAGLNLWNDGKIVPAEQIAEGISRLLGGGAGADEASDADLLGDKLGVWLRGNYGYGKKGQSLADRGFDNDQWGFTGGLDYRFTPTVVGGFSLGYGKAAIDFQPVGEGGVDTASFAGSLYGSAALGNFYVDAVLNYADTDYDTTRRIIYTDATGGIDRSALGSTSGDALSGGLSVGYDFIFGGLTVSPTAGYFFVDTNIDSFVENGATGLDLAYDEQHYESATGNVGLRITYAWKASWGVFIPHLRASYIREFEDATEVFGVRFASDPFNGSADPTPPIFVQSDEPDDSYFRIAAGFSAQLRYGLAGYAEYQRLESLEFINFHDFTVGLRFEHLFR